MKLAAFAYTRRGCETARRVIAAFPGAAYAPERFGQAGFAPITEGLYGELFQTMDALIFVGAAGIAVRSIAPYVRDKRTDPAVLCVDEAGRYVIPLLSGHIGGANALAETLAAALGATAVVTTATDVNGRFSVDKWAAENGYLIDDMAAAKAVSAAILEREIPLCCDLPIVGNDPPGVVPGNSGTLGIYIGWDETKPFETTLRLIPKVLRLGIGCRRGTDAAAIRTAVELVCAEHHIDIRAIKRAASIDLKSDEPGLLACCREMGWPLTFYSADELRAVPGAFSASAFVESVAGVGNVCERAAMLGAEKLIVRKAAVNGVTVAIAAEKAEVRFE